MNKTRFIQFRVTRDQYERIDNNARIKGYLSLSAYLRDLALNKDYAFQRKLDEIYEHIVKEKTKKEKPSKQSRLSEY